MKRMLMAGLLAVPLLAGCVVGPGRYGSGAVVVVPALPSIVVLDTEPYYQHGGYFYYYQGNRWSYSRSRNGPWEELPRDRYPREVKFKGKSDDKSRSDDGGRGEKPGRDKRDKD